MGRDLLRQLFDTVESRQLAKGGKRPKSMRPIGQGTGDVDAARLVKGIAVVERRFLFGDG